MNNINPLFISELFEKYNFNKEQFVTYRTISKGHINTTFVLYFDYGNKVKRYLLQEINVGVFKDPELLMNNISKVCSFCEKKLKEYDKNYKNKTLRIYYSKDNKTFVKLGDGSYWRVYHYVENGITYDESNDECVFYNAGQTIGEFQRLLSSFDSSQLYDIIQDFHNTSKRYEVFLKTINNCKKEMISTCIDEINFFIKNYHLSYKIQELIDKKIMPLKVTHNDTKLNNLMFEYKTNKGLCLVDLDTVMKGCICFDYGDFIRSACNEAEEDEKDLSKVKFKKDMFCIFTKGYLEKIKQDISQIELNHLVDGAIIMIYECGLRFLTDYLNGNKYFKTNYPEHNLDRCRTQICLCKQIINIQTELNEFVLNTYKNVAS